ncbi:MAG: PQQ-binding-like beta-propeller repeat protein, partial [Myxococcota bacterium]|nr:PQQ-binding-like beta-propeller repeat protein [Myxococcota bacterium]
MWSALFFGLVGPALAVDCPDGTGPVRTVLLGGLVEDGCATMAGVPHGPSEVRATDGTLRARGAWKDGARDGPWRHYDDAGRSREVGSYAGGARTGTWTTLSAAGSPVATVFHAELGGSAMGQGSPDPRIRWMTARPARVTGADGPQQTASIGAAGTRQPRVSVWGALALRSDAAGVSAIALADGATRFSVAPPDGLRAHPIGSRRFLAAVTGTGMALVVDPDAGHTVRIRTAAGATHVAAVDQDTVWVRDGVGRLAAWSWLDGSVRWQTRRSFGSVPPIYVAGAVLASRGREVSATDAKTGRRRWQARLDSEVLSVVAGREDTVLVGTASGTVERFAGGDGTPLETLAQPAGQILPGTLHDLPSGVLIRGADAVGWLGGETADGFGTPPDMADGLACGGSGSGGLVCRAPRAADSPLLLPELVPAGPVQFVGDLLLVPTLAGMTAVDL